MAFIATFLVVVAVLLVVWAVLVILVVLFEDCPEIVALLLAAAIIAIGLTCSGHGVKI